MRWIGAVLVVVCSGYIGFSAALSHKREECFFRQIIYAINYMECELQYRLTPLPKLFEQVSKETSGIAGKIFSDLACELHCQISPQVSYCVDTALSNQKNVPDYVNELFHMLGQSLGRFDLQGQLKDLDYVREFCKNHLKSLEANRDVRLRSYQTIGLCAGAALAILLL